MADVMSLLERQAARFPDKAAVCNGAVGHTEVITYHELHERAERLAAHLVNLGIGPEDKVAILSESRAEWGLCFFASIFTGAAVIPLDVKLSLAELDSIVRDCEPRVLFTSSAAAANAVELQYRQRTIEHVFLIDEDDENAPKENLAYIKNIKDPGRAPRHRPDPHDVAVIFYTSGTTGRPKGVMLTYDNLNFQLESLGCIPDVTKKDRFLSILPLSHAFEMTGGLLYLLSVGTTVVYSRTVYPQELLKLMRQHKTTALVGVPLFFHVLKTRMESQLLAKGKAVQAWFKATWALARLVPLAALRRVLFLPVLRNFGGSLRLFISGGAPLDPETGEFFNKLGVNMIEGYGLTETSPVISVNVPKTNRIGTVGRPLRGVEVKIETSEESGEGEILTRGRHVMKGYYRDEEATKSVIDADGWFRTGDLGMLKEDGFLKITGRLKNLIVLRSGQKVQPEEVEQVLMKAPSIQEICVCGRQNKNVKDDRAADVCAVVVPDEALFARLADDPEQLKGRIDAEIAAVATDLSPHKRPKKIFVSSDELPKTTTRKIKRPLVLKWIEDQEKPMDLPSGEAPHSEGDAADKTGSSSARA